MHLLGEAKLILVLEVKWNCGSPSVVSIYLFLFFPSLEERTKALFRCEKFLDFATVALSFVCGKYFPIIN